MTAAVLWLVAGLVLLGAEVLTGTFVLLMLGGGEVVHAVHRFHDHALDP